MSNIKIQVRLICDDPLLEPFYETEGAAGFDLKSREEIVIPGKSTVVVPTGIKVEIPIGYEIQVRPRSGISLKTKLRVANSPGTIDSDYRGEVGVILDNTGDEDITIRKYDRIAQGVLSKVHRINFWKVDALSESRRGEKGFGSTGV